MEEIQVKAGSNLAMLVSRGLTVLKSAAELAKQATSEIARDATNPDLVSALQAGGKMYDRWAQRIDHALGEVGKMGSGGPVVLQAIYDAGRKIRHETSDNTNRDLEIIENGQLALHTWIVTFGALRTYASRLGMSQAEQDMQASLEEAKQADAQHTAIADKILGAPA